MWVNKAERLWRRREEAVVLKAVAGDAEAHFAAFAGAIALLLQDTEGVRHLARHGINQAWCARSPRTGKTGAEGLSVLEGVVLAGTCSRLLDDPAFIRWMSKAHPDALQALHRVAGPLGCAREATGGPTPLSTPSDGHVHCFARS
ncbi:hypothetical protein [Luteibacter aegosomatissinici]|uniref:hypothetical protein n=1 Tax=Luteibacter aegosomatissinici TaxID=2911539 RepID=UPI001FF77689|nr:hypothetical protein [Luteibacter aegosomatissinici]UPG92845.1 hypothetical protein L2Y97_13320 [Luteibacter aegosomatissinici]